MKTFSLIWACIVQILVLSFSLSIGGLQLLWGKITGNPIQD